MSSVVKLIFLNVSQSYNVPSQNATAFQAEGCLGLAYSQLQVNISGTLSKIGVRGMFEEYTCFVQSYRPWNNQNKRVLISFAVEVHFWARKYILSVLVNKAGRSRCAFHPSSAPRRCCFIIVCVDGERVTYFRICPWYLESTAITL